MTGVKLKTNYTDKQMAIMEVTKCTNSAEVAAIDAHDNLCDALEKNCPSLAIWREKQFLEGNVVYPNMQQIRDFIFGNIIGEVKTPDIEGTDN